MCFFRLCFVLVLMNENNRKKSISKGTSENLRDKSIHPKKEVEKQTFCLNEQANSEELFPN